MLLVVSPLLGLFFIFQSQFMSSFLTAASADEVLRIGYGLLIVTMIAPRSFGALAGVTTICTSRPRKHDVTGLAR